MLGTFSSISVLTLLWFILVVTLNATGYFILQVSCAPSFRSFYCLRPKRRGAQSQILRRKLPNVTIIRPCSGSDPYLEQCLVSSLLQDYPSEKLTVFFCVHSRKDPSFPLLQRLCRHFPHYHTRIFVEDEGPLDIHIGPNPKVRNMSQAYHLAPSDIIWILDCNVWVRPGACQRMVQKLAGTSGSGPVRYPYNLVYQLPAYIAVRPAGNTKDGQDAFREAPMFGAQVEELYSSTAFAKMYTAINFWKIGPCVTGKSTMFRRSDLDTRKCGLHATGSTRYQDFHLHCNHTGLDTLSDVLCEDQTLADFLWNKKTRSPRKRHGLLLGELAIQPVSLGLGEYCIRHVRWIRARKWGFLLGTFLEPTTECLFCVIAASLAFQCLLYPSSNEGKDSYKWSYSAAFMGTSLLTWATIDYLLFQMLYDAHKRSGELPEDGEITFPEVEYVRPNLPQWILAWTTREILAFPIWAFAIFGGNTITWRDRNYSLKLNGKLRYQGN